MRNKIRFRLLRTLTYSGRSSTAHPESRTDPQENQDTDNRATGPVTTQVIASCFIPIACHQSSISHSSIALISVRPAGVKECKTQEVRKAHESLNGYVLWNLTPAIFAIRPALSPRIRFSQSASEYAPIQNDRTSSSTQYPSSSYPQIGPTFSRLPLLKFHAQNRSGISTLRPIINECVRRGEGKGVPSTKDYNVGVEKSPVRER
jgi:hypothetical protein